MNYTYISALSSINRLNWAVRWPYAAACPARAHDHKARGRRFMTAVLISRKTAGEIMFTLASVKYCDNDLFEQCY